ENSLVQLRALLQNPLHLPRDYQFKRIEGYDVSNTSGLQAVVSMVVFTNGEIDKSQYRSFNIKTLNTPNDYQMLQEALLRRVQHQEWDEPSLLLIDGGKGQVRKVWQALQNTRWQQLPLIGLAKDPDRVVIPIIEKDKIINWEIASLTSDNLALQLLQQIRDEAHRFGKSRHVRRREKQLLGI
ncbi:MAG: excinuclease ABC subunit C, partial [bacterium]|nr:excinuclease ABC subunit C [bacterium]